MYFSLLDRPGAVFPLPRLLLVVLSHFTGNLCLSDGWAFICYAKELALYTMAATTTRLINIARLKRTGRIYYLRSNTLDGLATETYLSVVVYIPSLPQIQISMYRYSI